jgi:hypothetical protein
MASLPCRPAVDVSVCSVIGECALLILNHLHRITTAAPPTMLQPPLSPPADPTGVPRRRPQTPAFSQAAADDRPAPPLSPERPNRADRCARSRTAPYLDNGCPQRPRQPALLRRKVVCISCDTRRLSLVPSLGLCCVVRSCHLMYHAHWGSHCSFPPNSILMGHPLGKAVQTCFGALHASCSILSDLHPRLGTDEASRATLHRLQPNRHGSINRSCRP